MGDAQDRSLHYNEWGEGDPLIALHPLALESSAFAGVAKHLETMGLRTIAVDLPGFGCTPRLDVPLTPAALAQPVIELARSLERPPILMGMSMGGRVALEVALRAPDAARGLVLVAPFLPLSRISWLLWMARFLEPAWGERLPLERVWPLLKLTTDLLESVPRLEHDWFTRACVRVAYYSACPDTRTAFLSASREMALDPTSGEDGLWARLAEIEVPTTFLWAGRDFLIPRSHAKDVRRAMPQASHMEVPCSGHFVNFRHFRCMEHAIALATGRVLDEELGAERIGGRVLTPCLAEREEERVRLHRHRAIKSAPVLRQVVPG
jgi:pimeloyl-ACP methyl ester carboxylesterase